MKKYIKSIFAIVISTALLMQNSILAMSDESSVVNFESQTTTVAADFVKTESNEFTTVRNLSALNLNRCLSAYQKTNLTSDDTNVMVLKSLGFHDDEIETIGQAEINTIVSDAASISVTEKYLKVNDQGEAVPIAKDTCLTEVESRKTAELSAARLASNDGSNTEDSDDGYMRILTTASYIRPGQYGAKGWYYISGTFTWLTMPDYRMKDAMSLYADECMWSQNAGDYYSTFTYKAYNFSGFVNTYTENKTTEKSLYADGLYYEWKLPRDSIDIQIGLAFGVVSMSFYVRGKVQAKNHVSANNFNIYTRYEHTYSSLNIQAGFGWSSGSLPGVTASGTFGTGHTPYTSLCEVHYDPNQNIYK